MAGDVDLIESLMPISDENNIRQMSPAPIIHDYGESVKIAAVKYNASENSNADTKYTFSEELGLQAFRQRSSESFMRQKKERPFASETWGDAERKAPLHLNRTAIVRGAPINADPNSFTNAPEAKRLAGRVAVGIIMVSGPGNLSISSSQQVDIVAEVQNGLSFLAKNAPAKDVTFAYDIQIPAINVPRLVTSPPSFSAENDKYEHYEMPWRDAALQNMGYKPGHIGINEYIRSLKARLHADSAYCAFFTHYDLYHFAYCSGSYITMSYANDGWGPNNLDRVFAHETGHIFGAPDEYKSSGCDCGGSWGVYGKPNLNCENCADNGGVPCIMKSNTWAMCNETPYHLGYTMKTV